MERRRTRRFAVNRQPDRPVLITNAARSQDEQLRSRQIRYMIMMGTRIGFLILGGILISAKVPLLPLWLVLCAVGMAVLPWLAVLVANDRPPKEQHRLSRLRHRDAAEAPSPRALPTEPGARRTIDVDP
jgi:hypothetical protein